MIKKKFLAAPIFLMFLSAISLLLPAVPGYGYDGSHHYRFDDISGTSGRGSQWVVMTASSNSIGAPLEGPHSEDIKTSGDIVDSRSPVYIRNAVLNNIVSSDEPISFIFAAFSGTTVSPVVEFAWRGGVVPGTDVSYTQDVTIGGDAYSAEKTSLSGSFDPVKRFQFSMTKTKNSSSFGTERTYMRFHQNPYYDPSQTLQIPFVLANVASGSARQSPLLFRAALRNLLGDIAAYDHFEWSVDGNKEVDGGDWIFVPLKSESINANAVNYRLVSSVRNFSGIRYGLDRYDMLGNRKTLHPYKWTMDLPADVKDVSNDIRLDELSHMPPGLITAYDQSFDVVSGRQNVFSVYAIDPDAIDPDGGTPLDPFDLTLVHPQIFGVNRGESSGADYHVTGFQLLPSDINFMKNASSALGGRKIVIPSADIVDGTSVSGEFITADAIATVKVERAIPESMMRSNDVTAILPLHITLNLPSTNRFISPKWNELLEEFKKSGNARNLFADNFSLYSYSENRRTDIFAWLAGRGALEKTVKVFVDEEKGHVTLSFIVLLLDGNREISTLRDSSAVSSFSYDYLTMGDGNENDAWEISFYAAPLGDSQDGPGTSGGGGCNAGLTAALLLPAVAAFKKR